MLITLEEAKQYLDVIHDADDDKLEILLEAAIDEGARYLGYDGVLAYEDYIESSENPSGELPKSVMMGMLLLLQRNYQTPVNDIAPLRKAAETLLFPYRIGFGI
jgi:hypothetical protein